MNNPLIWITNTLKSTLIISCVHRNRLFGAIWLLPLHIGVRYRIDLEICVHRYCAVFLSTLICGCLFASSEKQIASHGKNINMMITFIECVAAVAFPRIWCGLPMTSFDSLIHGCVYHWSVFIWERQCMRTRAIVLIDDECFEMKTC